MEKHVGGIQNFQNKQSLQIKKLEEFEPRHRTAMETLDLKLETLYKDKGGGENEMKALRIEVEQAVNTVNKSTRDAAMDLHNLRGELSAFAGNIEENSEHLRDLQSKFKPNLEHNVARSR